MTVTITSSLRIGLVSGTGVNFNAPLVPQITTDDIFAADNPTQTLTDLIGGLSGERLFATISVNGTSVANHPMYTVPAGDIFVPTKLVVYLSTITGSGKVPVFSLGKSGNFQELIDDTRQTTYTLASGITFAQGSAYTNGDILTVVGGTHSVVATLTVDTVDGMGHVTGFSVVDGGTYTALPTNPLSVTGGTGTLFSFNATFAVSRALLEDDFSMEAAQRVQIITPFTSYGSSSGANVKYLSGGDVVTLRVPFASTYSAYTFKAFLFGFLAS